MSELGSGSSYEGDYKDKRYEGYGTYKSSYGTYTGNFFDGYFHGQGTLLIKGGEYSGIWKNGALIDGKFKFLDGLEHKNINEKDWNYCSNKDPRFYCEIVDGLSLGSQLIRDTPAEVTPIIPFGCYDTLDGYYDPKKFCVFDYDTHEQVRMPTQEESQWIVDNCRSNV